MRSLFPFLGLSCVFKTMSICFLLTRVGNTPLEEDSSSNPLLFSFSSRLWHTYPSWPCGLQCMVWLRSIFFMLLEFICAMWRSCSTLLLGSIPRSFLGTFLNCLLSPLIYLLHLFFQFLIEANSPTKLLSSHCPSSCPSSLSLPFVSCRFSIAYEKLKASSL